MAPLLMFSGALMSIAAPYAWSEAGAVDIAASALGL
jgi:hypothetical protein